MKKIAIIFNKIGPKKQIFIDYFINKFKNKVNILPIKTKEISISIINGKTNITFGKENIDNIDLVYFRQIGDKNLSIANIIANYLSKRKVKFIDNSLMYTGKGEDKLTNNYILANENIPIINTVYSSDWNEIISLLASPVIAKDIDKQRNEGVFMIKDKNDFDKLIKSFPEGRFIYQQFMKIEKEYRLLVMGDKVRTVLVKDKRNYDFKVSAPVGIIEEYLEVSKIPENFKKIAIDTAKALNLQIAGIDLMIEEGSGKLFIIEANRGPGITIDSDKSPELSALAGYLEEEVFKK